MIVPESPYHLLKFSIDLEELAPGSVVALARNINRANDTADRAYEEHGVHRGEHLGVFDELWASLTDLPETNIHHARNVFRAFAESPLAEDRAFGASLMHKLTRNDHDLGYGLWHRLARDPAQKVRHEATYFLRDFFRNSQFRPERQQEFDYLGISADEALSLVHVSEQVNQREIPPFDLGQETLAIALGHAALPEWARFGRPSA